MFQRIFVPLDGSPGAERAIPVAARLARSAPGGTILFCHVIQPSAAPQGSAGRRLLKEVPAEVGELALTNAGSFLAATLAAYAEELAGIPTEIDGAFGRAAPALSSVAHGKQTDLMVMCTHRKVGLGRWGRETSLVLTEHGSALAR